MRLSSPVYEIPMSDSDLIITARITIAWSHMDAQVDLILSKIGKFRPEVFNHLFAGKTIGPKTEAIGVYAKSINEPLRGKLIAMRDAIQNCNRDRNLMTHGIWGWEVERTSRKYRPCAWSQFKDKILALDDLPSLHEKVHIASLRTDEAFYATMNLGEPPPERNRRMAFADRPPESGDPPPPQKLAR